MTESFYSEKAMGHTGYLNPIFGKQLTQVQHFVIEPSPTHQILDLGCGAGSATQEVLAKFGWDSKQIVGVDFSVTAGEVYQSRTGSSFLQADVCNLPFENDQFDVVICDDVIEHLVETDNFAREIHRVTKSGGLIFLSTPNLAAWINRIALVFGMQPAFSEVSNEKIFGRPGDDPVGHLRLFTLKSLRQFFEYHNFEIVSVGGAGFEALPRVLGPLDRLLCKYPPIACSLGVVLKPK